MALNVAFWRIGTKAIRVVTADGPTDEPTVGVPLGSMLTRTDTGEHRAFNGATWASSGGGTLIVRAGTEVAGSGVTVKAGSCDVLYDFGA